MVMKRVFFKWPLNFVLVQSKMISYFEVNIDY